MGRVLRACLLALAGLLVLVVMAVVGLVLVLRPGPQAGRVSVQASWRPAMSKANRVTGISTQP